VERPRKFGAHQSKPIEGGVRGEGRTAAFSGKEIKYSRQAARWLVLVVLGW
jgi:hypothetical protein